MIIRWMIEGPGCFEEDDPQRGEEIQQRTDHVASMRQSGPGPSTPSAALVRSPDGAHEGCVLHVLPSGWPRCRRNGRDGLVAGEVGAVGRGGLLDEPPAAERFESGDNCFTRDHRGWCAVRHRKAWRAQTFQAFPHCWQVAMVT